MGTKVRIPSPNDMERDRERKSMCNCEICTDKDVTLTTQRTIGRARIWVPAGLAMLLLFLACLMESSSENICYQGLVSLCTGL